MNTIVNYRQVPVTEVLVIVDWKLLNACSVKMTCLDIRETLMQGVSIVHSPPPLENHFFFKSILWLVLCPIPTQPRGEGG